MLRKSEIDFLYLLNLGTRQSFDNAHIIEKLDLEKIYKIAVHSGLSAYLNYVLEKNGIRNDKFLYSRDRIIAYQIQLDLQEKWLDALLSKNNISYYPLKGMKIKDCYPEFALREMGDLDILVDKSNRVRIKELLLSNGFYSSDDNLSGYHDSYKNYQFEIEAHYQLINGGLSTFWKKFNKIAKDNAKHIDGSSRYELSIEDQYIYILMHAYKHHILKGVGVRFLLDIFYYRKNYLDQMDQKYIEETMNKLKLSEFEKEMVSVADLLFKNDLRETEINEEFETLLANFIRSGAVQGSQRDGQIIEKHQEISGKSFLEIFVYSLNKLDENDKWYAFHNYFAYKQKWFRPLYLFYISVKKFINNPYDFILTYGVK